MSVRARRLSSTAASVRYAGMARPIRPRVADLPMHVMQRGVNHAVCFRAHGDYTLYLGLLEECARERRCAIHAYVLMTNHVHLLLTPGESNACSWLMKDVGQRYSQHCNRTWQRSGPLWDGRFKACLVESDAYLMTCQRYIEMNPVRAGMVRRPGDYAWSSFRTNALGVSSMLLSPHTLFRSLGRDENACRHAYRAMFDSHEDPMELERIRNSLHGGVPLGSPAFVEKLERITGRRLRASSPRIRCTTLVRNGV